LNGLYGLRQIETYLFGLLFLKDVVKIDENHFHNNFDSQLENKPESNFWRPDDFNQTTLISCLRIIFKIDGIEDLDSKMFEQAMKFRKIWENLNKLTVLVFILDRPTFFFFFSIILYSLEL